MPVNREELEHYRLMFENELFSILSYWINYSLEEDERSFYGAVDINNLPVIDADKSCVLNARILWTFSAAAIKYQKDEYSKIADIAYNVVANDFYDKEHGGYFMMKSADNFLINSTKHTYAQAFVLYSLCKYYELTSNGKVLNEIRSLFDLLENITKDPTHPGYFEAFSREWEIIDENRMADNNEPRSMNTHLHMLEAYSELFKIMPDIKVKERLKELMDIFINAILREDGHLGIFFDLEFNEVDSSKGISSFGHDIEASWLLWKAAENLNDPAMKKKVLPLVLKMVDIIKREGVDSDGGLFLESYRFGSHLRTNKHWWIQAENLVGFMNAYQLTNNGIYWQTVKLAWNFIDKHVIDHKNGEWFTKVNRMGDPFLIEPEDDPSPYYRNDWKIDPWKCPYHNGRAMMELIERIDKLIP
jgi:mannobiose 2-epimerase